MELPNPNSSNVGSVGNQMMENQVLNEKYTITIEPLDYGYKVRVGCQTFAIESTETLVSKLNKYFENPQKMVQEWNKTNKI